VNPLLERRLARAGFLTLSGVAVGAASLLWRHPLAFIAFASLGGGLVATGILIYLWAIAAPARP
jgi:hypothetical protein